jgi:hypothetical protein
VTEGPSVKSRSIIDIIRRLDSSRLQMISKSTKFPTRPDNYLHSYRPILDYFSSIEAFSAATFILGVTIVYGWMPTIMRLKAANFDECAQILNKVKAGDIIDVSALETLKRMVGNSMVGTSKLLHFVRPTIYPIWDRKICGIITEKKTYGQGHNDCLVYAAYMEKLMALSEERKVLELAKYYRLSRDYLASFTNIRIIEMMLYYSDVGKN